MRMTLVDGRSPWLSVHIEVFWVVYKVGDVQERIERNQFYYCISGNRRTGLQSDDATLTDNRRKAKSML